MSIEMTIESLEKSIHALRESIERLIETGFDAPTVARSTPPPQTNVTPLPIPSAAPVQPVVSAPPVPSTVTPDFATTRKTLAGIAEKLGNPQPVVDIMNRFGAQRLSDIKAEMYPALIAEAQKLVS